MDLTPPTVDAEMIIRDMTGNEFNGFSWTNSSFFDEFENDDGTDQLSSATTSTNLWIIINCVLAFYAVIAVK